MGSENLTSIERIMRSSDSINENSRSSSVGETSPDTRNNSLNPSFVENTQSSKGIQLARRGTTADSDSLHKKSLIDKGIITEKQANRIKEYQKEIGASFIEAASQLGLVPKDEKIKLLAKQFGYNYIPADDESLSKELDTAHTPESSYAESIRGLRSDLMGHNAFKNKRIITVISPNRKDGRSRLAANLAIVFAQLGQNTLLIDGDLRHPRINRFFGLQNVGGLSMVLAGAAFDQALHTVPYFPTLTVMTSGPRPPNPQELLTAPTFHSLLQSASSKYFAVIIDTSAASLGSDWEWIAKASGSAILVTRRQHTKMRDLTNLTRRIHELDVTVSASLLVA